MHLNQVHEGVGYDLERVHSYPLDQDYHSDLAEVGPRHCDLLDFHPCKSSRPVEYEVFSTDSSSAPSRACEVLTSSWSWSILTDISLMSFIRCSMASGSILCVFGGLS